MALHSPLSAEFLLMVEQVSTFNSRFFPSSIRDLPFSHSFELKSALQIEEASGLPLFLPFPFPLSHSRRMVLLFSKEYFSTSSSFSFSSRSPLR